MKGLDRKQRANARELAVNAAYLGLHNAPEVHYTQGPRRWEGIARHDVASDGQYPNHADCSAFVTWCLWNPLKHVYGLPDVVNGDSWQGGYTGTLAQHGREVIHVGNVIRGDIVLYGSAAPYDHTAIVVGHKDGKPVVVSHGSEGGPYLLSFDYRSDVAEFRRMILPVY